MGNEMTFVLEPWIKEMPEDKRIAFASAVKGVERSIEVLFRDAAPRDFEIPIKSEDVRIKMCVFGKPTRDDWIRVQAFAALAAGEMDNEDPESKP